MTMHARNVTFQLQKPSSAEKQRLNEARAIEVVDSKRRVWVVLEGNKMK